MSTLGGCSDIGVFGPVPGMIGILQALEALKAILHLESLKNISIRERKRHELEKQQNGEVDSDNVHYHHHVHNSNNNNINNSGMAASIMAGRMLVWDAYMGTFRIMKMRPRSVTGVERAKQGTLSSLGGEYDGCTLEIVSDPEVTVENVEPSEILRELHLTTKNNDFSGEDDDEEDDKDDADRERTTNNNNSISEQQKQLHSDKRRRQRDEGSNNNNNHIHHSVVITAAHVRNQLRDYLHPQEKKVNVNINLQHHQFPTKSITKGHPDFCSDSSSTIYMPPAQELLLQQQKQKQEQEEQKANDEKMKNQPRQVKLVLFLDVRKTIQQRLCSLDDLYEIPSLSNSSANDNIKTLILHLGIPFSDLQKKVNNLMNILSEMNDGVDDENDRSSSIEHEISVELFLSELFLIGSSPNKEILQNSQHVRDLLTPENVANIEILCLCRRGIDSAKSVIVLEKLRRAIKQHRDEMRKKNPSLYLHHHQQNDHNQDQAVGEDESVKNKTNIFTTCTDLFISEEHFAVKNVKGGLNLWSLKADDHFPYY